MTKTRKALAAGSIVALALFGSTIVAFAQDVKIVPVRPADETAECVTYRLYRQDSPSAYIEVWARGAVPEQVKACNRVDGQKVLKEKEVDYKHGDVDVSGYLIWPAHNGKQGAIYRLPKGVESQLVSKTSPTNIYAGFASERSEKKTTDGHIIVHLNKVSLPARRADKR